MKVLLKKDVAGQGKAGTVIEVSDGYGRNFLIPRGLAVPADAESINAARIRKDAQSHKLKMQRERAKELASEVSKLTVKDYAKAGENGRLFGSVTNQEIADALKAQDDIEIDKKKINLPVAIKSFGEYTAEIKLYPEVAAKIKVFAKEQE